MATTSVRLQQDPSNSGGLIMAGNPSNNGANACYLRNGDSLSVSLDTRSLPSTAKFTSISFYPNGNENPGDAATINFGTAASPRRVVGYDSNPNDPAISLFSVSWNTADLTQPVTITDSDSDSGDDPAWFAINVADPNSGRSWRLDPEIVNTGGTKSGWQPSEGATLSRVAVAAAAMLEVEDEVAPGPLKKGKGKGAGKGKGKGKDGGKNSKGKSKDKGKDKSKDKGKGKGQPKDKSKGKSKGTPKSKSQSKSQSKSKPAAKAARTTAARPGRAAKTAAKKAPRSTRSAATKATRRK